MNRYPQILGTALMALSLGALAQAQSGDSPKAAQPQRAAAAIKKLDLNADGSISREEAAKSPRLAKNFSEIDRNRDGKLTPDEIRAYRATRERGESGRSAERSAQAFKGLDGNHDGLLSREEMRTARAARRTEREKKT